MFDCTDNEHLSMIGCDVYCLLHVINLFNSTEEPTCSNQSVNKNITAVKLLCLISILSASKHKIDHKSLHVNQSILGSEIKYCSRPTESLFFIIKK